MRMYLSLLSCGFLLTLAGAGNGATTNPTTNPNPIQATPWQGDDHAAVRLLAFENAADQKESATNPAQTWLGLEFRLAAGWHIYGRDPGEAGLPPSVRFLAKNESYRVTDSAPAYPHRKLGYAPRILWPADKILDILGIKARGYDEAVILPILITPNRPANSHRPPDQATQAAPYYRLAVNYAACAEICVPFHAELALDRAAAARLEGGELQRVRQLWQNNLAQVAAPELAAALAGRVYHYPKISLADGGANLTQSPPAKLNPPKDVSLMAAVGLALLGGIILNFMPCVLPVVSLKLIGFSRLASGSRAQARSEMAAMFGGIVVTFLVLGAVLAVLKHSGAAIGWGIQFQYPWFLAFMTLVLFIFALNLLGVFAIALPPGMNRLMTWLGVGAMQPLERRHRQIWLNGLGTGVVSTLLATPCSAPLVGAALTYALSRQTPEIMLIFGSMGVGFAAFYGVAFLFPGLGKIMPKPGAWTLRMRQVLGVIMMASAVWLGYLTWSSATHQDFRANSGQNVQPNTLAWQEFSPAALARLQAQKRVILVDVTAAWCLTCKANEALVLNTDAVRRLVAAESVALLRADWTKPDAEIAAYLAANHRYGIPFNAVYGPGHPEAQILPEILRFEDLRLALLAAKP
ncbi:MAG: thioredoxin family protein [Candidatus Symbiobacter sp.]|nr:thioredoxin family protein [Candidatus Symbiobacter sp.]